MLIEEYRAEDRVLLNAWKIKQQSGIQKTLYLTRLRLELKKQTNKTKSIDIRLKYSLCYFLSKFKTYLIQKNGTSWLQ